MIKHCKFCGKEFEYTHGNKKYCSIPCREQATRKKYGTEYRKQYYETHREEERENARRYYRLHHKLYKRATTCCRVHGGINNCPYDDCICE